MNAFDLPRRRSGRRGNLVPVPDPHQPATSGFSDPAPVQFSDRLAAIEADMATVAVDMAWMRRVLERLADDEDLDPGSYDHPTWISEPAEPAWHADPDATLAGQVSPADLTMPDQRAHMARPYAPEPEPEIFVVPPVTADLDALPLFRATVHAELVRRPGGRGDREGGTWQERWAARYEHLLGEELLVANWGAAS